MKFKKLNSKFDEVLDRKDQGKPLPKEDLANILALLEEKKTGYESQLKEASGEKDRHKLEVKLRVIELQIEKLRTIAGAG